MPNGPRRARPTRQAGPARGAALGRRTVLTAALAGSVIGVTGCGIRLESDAPHIPGIKKQAPPADQAVLRTLLTGVEATVMCAEHDDHPSKWTKSLGTIHRAQRRRLVKVMATQGMTPAPTPTSGASGQSGRVSNTEPVPLADIEHRLAGTIGSLAGLSTQNLPMAAAIGVTRAAAAQVLDKPARSADFHAPQADAAKEILPTLQAAVYAFEMVVAKTPLDSRKTAEATLGALRPWRAQWEAALGDEAPAQPDGYRLPVQPTSDAKRRKLAQRVLSDLSDVCAGQIAATRNDRTSFVAVTGLWSDATAQHWRWGATPTPFPGLQ